MTDQVDKMSRLLFDEPAVQSRHIEIRGAKSDDNVVDWKQLIGRIVDEKLVAEIMPVCVDDNRDRLKTLATAVEMDDCENVKSCAHSIKGSTANLGAKRLSKLAHRLENMASQGDLSQARELLKKIRAEFERFESFVSNPNWIEIAKKQSE